MRVKFHLGLCLFLIPLSFSCYASLPNFTPAPSISQAMRDAKTREAFKKGDIGHNQSKGIGAIGSTKAGATDPQERDKQNLDPSQDKNAAVIKMAQDKIAEKNPDQKGGYVAEVIAKGTSSQISSDYPEFFNNKIINRSTTIEIGKLIEFDENGNTIAEDFYVRGGGDHNNSYGVDKLEYMSMPYGKYKCVYQDENGVCQKWSDTGGQWVNTNDITLRVNSNPNNVNMSPGVTTERIHPITSSNMTQGCYGLLKDNSIASTNYGLDSNLEGITNFANARVYLGKLNGLYTDGNQRLAGYRTPVMGKTSL